MLESFGQAWCLCSQALVSLGAEREAGVNPARSRHCNRATRRASQAPGSQIPAVEEEQTLSAERATPPLFMWGADSVRPIDGQAGE